MPWHNRSPSSKTSLNSRLIRLRISTDRIKVLTAALCRSRSSSKIVSTASRFPAFGLRGCFDQSVGHAAHGGDNDHYLALARSLANDFDDFADAGCVAHRRPAKLHDAKWLLHGILRFAYPYSTHLLSQSTPTARLSAASRHGLGGANSRSRLSVGPGVPGALFSTITDAILNQSGSSHGTS